MRKKNKRAEMRMEAVCELMELCLKINSLEKRTRERTGNLPTVFTYYFGHTSRLNIQIHSNGYVSSESEDVEFYISLNSSDFWKEYNYIKAKLTEMVKGR